jgi:fatty acid desaturase
MRETQRDFESPMQPSTSREVVPCIGGTAALLLAVASDLWYVQNTFTWLLVVLMHQCGPGEADVCQRP